MCPSGGVVRMNDVKLCHVGTLGSKWKKAILNRKIIKSNPQPTITMLTPSHIRIRFVPPRITWQKCLGSV